MPEKKSSPKTKADIQKNKGTEKKSSTVKKELTTLTAKETKTTEKKSVTLLKEAINNAKNKALDNKVVAKPIKKKSSTVKKTEEKLDKPEKAMSIKKDTTKETKATYTKSDIIKPKEDSVSVVFEKEKTETIDLPKTNIETEKKSVDSVDIEINDNNTNPSTNDSTYTKESILSILTRDDNSDSKEDMFKESIKNLQDKIRSKQEEEEEIKKNLEARNTVDNFIEKDKPSSPKVEDTRTIKPERESVPTYSHTQYSKPEKKERKKPFLLIFGIILIIAGSSFGIFKFVLNKENDDIPVNAYVELEEPLEDATDDSINNMEDSSTNENLAPLATTEQTETPKVEDIVEEATPKADEVETQTPAPKIEETEKKPTVVETPVAPTPPVAPATPTAPEIVPPTTKAPTKPYIIAWKDTLQAISENELGDIRRWPTIYSLNKGILKSPDSYKFGTTLYIPMDKKQIENMNAAEKESLYNDYKITIEAYKKINNPGMVIILERDAKTLKLK